ncbi:AraC family transcriptional regulator [Actinoplanes aureus]|uniref:Helix-turn-helix domain-containing protein n=1 Tax=Actinoplanes aureus TaxID=2792083 RepID=A0A931FZ83_9ACTN|nr:helix-turn-helix domain-containing protein [Actinoplanes aureus]MBG0565408.1 helix-turn-helix domain-containing protein [Actinoplanes aureus]
MDPYPGQTRPALSVRTRDPDEARAVCGEHLYPRSMRLLEPGASLDARFGFLHLGSLTVADVRYGAAVAGVTGSLDSYHLNVAQAGRFWACQGGRPISGGPGRSAVYQPDGETELHYASADCHLLAVKVDRLALEAHLGAVLGRDVHDTVRLSGQIEAEGAAGRTVTGLVRFLAAEIGNAGSMFYEPIVAAPLEEALLTALLMATDHQYRDLLRVRAPWRHAPRSILPAVDAIHGEPRRAYTAAALAGIAGISPGQLRLEFQRQFGMAPMAYVREVRLVAARADLLLADPNHTSVSAVARRWGFSRPAGFTARYQARFHESPAAALRHEGA